MKFAVFTVVVLALVFRAQSSVIPLGLGGPLISVASHAVAPVAVVPNGSVSVQAANALPIQGLPAAVTVAESPARVVALPAAVAVAAHAPVAVAAHAPVAIAAPAPVAVAAHAPVAIAAPVVAAQGTYVAKTRGAIHVAPLEGHLQSAASVNLEPAPGTL